MSHLIRIYTVCKIFFSYLALKELKINPKIVQQPIVNYQAISLHTDITLMSHLLVDISLSLSLTFSLALTF